MKPYYWIIKKGKFQCLIRDTWHKHWSELEYRYIGVVYKDRCEFCELAICFMRFELAIAKFK